MHAQPTLKPSRYDSELSAPRRLTESDRAAVLEHLLRLCADDRATRCYGAMVNAAIEARVADLDFDHTACFGRFRAGRLVSFAEGHCFETAAGPRIEAALPTDGERDARASSAHAPRSRVG